MIGQLPTSIKVNGKEIAINTDFRTALIVLVACNDVELSDREKVYVMVDALVGFENLAQEDVEEAIKQCSWFMDGGKDYSKAKNKPKLMDWEQDFYKENQDLIDFKTVYTEKEKEEMRKLNERFK